jgi:hypothetical protein
MNSKIDIRSAMLGLVLGVIATAAIGAVSSAGQSGRVGRYQIGGTSNQGFVLDTATGQVWSSYFSSAGGRGDADFFRPKASAEKE